MQKFVAKESFWNLFPDASIGVMAVSGLKGAGEVSSEDVAEIAALLSDVNERANR